MKNIIMWDEYEKEYEVYGSWGYWYVNNITGKHIKTNKVKTDYDFNVDDYIYLEDEDLKLHVIKIFKTDKGNSIYECESVLVPQENDKELREIAEQQLKDKLEEIKKENERLDVETKSILKKIKFGR